MEILVSISLFLNVALIAAVFYLYRRQVAFEHAVAEFAVALRPSKWTRLGSYLALGLILLSMFRKKGGES